MARRPTPWFRKGRGWYVQHRGKQVALGKDKAEAFRRFHALMQKADDAVAQGDSFAAICDEFLEWTLQHRARRTYDWYVALLQPFAAFLKTHGFVGPAEGLRPLHVRRWLEQHPTWGGTTQRQAIAAVQRCYNWAVRMGFLDRSPMTGIEKPQANVRTLVVTPAAYKALLSEIKDEAFRDLVVIAWETGCRPQEAIRVEARHVDLANRRWVFPPSEAKGKRKPRIIYLTDKAMAITRRCIERNPTGALLRNRAGRPWTSSAAKCRFSNLADKLGATYCLYNFRHSFATRMLESGLDALTVALLLGHSNPAMLSTTYQHLAHNPAHLLSQLASAGK
ncbi:tyrosine-type recombinase/integrase [Botrimarina mediterranea]|uniref:tyrosine-type recombinase/integrase n=1 Tax=Botrimarina mediterranea TaxID=2528022 RepID=UPI0011881370|nr:Tyrosine recombinase XerC [Planctomycetes bacterium K2D]